MMSMNPSKRSIALHDSSLTRVQPVFRLLFRKDPSGLTWLPKLLGLVDPPGGLAGRLIENLTPLLPEILRKRRIGSKNLRYAGIECLEREACFEKTLPPSENFLRWLIQHPEHMTWPRKGKQTYSEYPQARREAIFGLHGRAAQAQAQTEALAALDRLGVEHAHGKWWSFEGTSFVDCYLETSSLVLLIEGKRTEKLSSTISFYPQRNQLVRFLEIAQEIAHGRDFAVLVITEKGFEPLSESVVAQSLPHFSQAERQELMVHFLGATTWKELCLATGVDYGSLPETIHDLEEVLRTKED